MVTRNYGAGLYGSAVYGKATTYQVAADQTAYVYQGIAAGMWWGRYRIIAAYSSFAHAGQAAGLRVMRCLTAAYGALNEAGQAANLTRTLKLFSDGASYVFTHDAASLFVTRVLDFARGAFVLSAADNALGRGSVWTREVDDVAVWSEAAESSDVWIPAES